MAPPGYELREGAEWISECEIGFFKEGWNKNPCIPVSGDMLQHDTVGFRHIAGLSAGLTKVQGLRNCVLVLLPQCMKGGVLADSRCELHAVLCSSAATFKSCQCCTCPSLLW
jgi:hypothetical protein